MCVSVAESKRLSAQRCPNFTDNRTASSLHSLDFNFQAIQISEEGHMVQQLPTLDEYMFVFFYNIAFPFVSNHYRCANSHSLISSLQKSFVIWLQAESLKWSKCRGAVVRFVITPRTDKNSLDKGSYRYLCIGIYTQLSRFKSQFTDVKRVDKNEKHLSV